MIKCLLSYSTSHYVLHLNANASGYLTFEDFKKCLKTNYNHLIEQLSINSTSHTFEIYDSDFEEYVIVDQLTRISNLSKLKVIKIEANDDQLASSKHSDLSNQQTDNTRSKNNNSLDHNKNNSLNNALSNRSKENSLCDLNLLPHETNSVNKHSSTDLIRGLSNDLHRGLPTNFNQAIKLRKQPYDLNSTPVISNQAAALNTSFKTYQTATCQTDETEKRVIHLKENPYMQHCVRLKADYQRLIEDNKRLNAKLELYKQGSVANATNYLEDFVYNADEIERLKKELQEAKEEQKTIMEAFKKKSKEFRRVVYLLTGFKFDALEQRKYRVSHIYSNPNEYLFFTFEKEEVINLLGNEFSEKFYDLINTYLVEYGSYPSFLASITIKLFKEKQMEKSKKEIKP